MRVFTYRLSLCTSIRCRKIPMGAKYVSMLLTCRVTTQMPQYWDNWWLQLDWLHEYKSSGTLATFLAERGNKADGRRLGGKYPERWIDQMKPLVGHILPEVTHMAQDLNPWAIKIKTIAKWCHKSFRRAMDRKYVDLLKSFNTELRYRILALSLVCNKFA